MAYGKDDPRAALATATRPDSGDDIAAAQYFDLHATSIVRAQNVILVHTDAKSGDDLDNGTLEGELAIVVTGASPAFTVLTDDGATKVEEPGLVVVPPGASRISV